MYPLPLSMRRDLKIIKPNIRYEKSYKGYVTELGDEERYPFPLDFDHSDFTAWLKRVAEFEQGIDLPEGYVSSSTYFMVADGDILGISNLRHQMNDALLQAGGHIGLSTRPSLRGQGLGIMLLQMTLKQAVLRGMDKVHIHCYANNPASAKMIEACGGVLDSEFKPDDGPVVLRYLIKL